MGFNHRLSRMRRAGHLVALLCATGCLPTIAHGPRIDPGFRMNINVVIPVAAKADDDTNAPNAVASVLGIGASYAVAASPGRPGLRLGTNFGIPLEIGPDLYLQAPTNWLGLLSGGVGFAHIQPARTSLPYLQVGRISDGQTGPYFTFGFVNSAGRGTQLNPQGDGWLTTFAYQFRPRRVTWHAFATLVGGRRYPANCGALDCGRLRPPLAVLLGVMSDEHPTLPPFVLRGKS